MLYFTYLLQRIFPALCNLVDERGKVGLKTTVSPELVMAFLDAYASKNIQAMIDTKAIIGHSIQGFDDDICYPLGLPLLSDLPTLHYKQKRNSGEASSLQKALQGKPKENYISFIIGHEIGAPSWKQALAFICLEKLKVASIIDKTKVENNIVKIEFNRNIHDDHKSVLLILVGAYINACAEKNPVIKTQRLQEICNQVPAVIKTIFISNIARILGLAEKDVIGFENNALYAQAKGG